MIACKGVITFAICLHSSDRRFRLDQIGAVLTHTLFPVDGPAPVRLGLRTAGAVTLTEYSRTTGSSASSVQSGRQVRLSGRLPLSCSEDKGAADRMGHVKKRPRW